MLLGASPDGLVRDPVECTPDRLIEIKHIVLQGGETLTAALMKKRICKWSKVIFKQKSPILFSCTTADVLLLQNMDWVSSERWH